MVSDVLGRKAFQPGAHQTPLVHAWNLKLDDEGIGMLSLASPKTLKPIPYKILLTKSNTF